MPILNTIPYTFRAQLLQHAYPHKKPPFIMKEGFPIPLYMVKHQILNTLQNRGAQTVT